MSVLPREQQLSRATRSRGRRRPAMVLVVVLIVVAMLSLAGFTFNELMVTEHASVRASGNQVQARLAIESATELICVELEKSAGGQSAPLSGTDEQQIELWRDVTLEQDQDGPSLWRFTVISPTVDATTRGVQYGLSNESARLNLEALLAWDKAQPGAARDALMMLPGMTLEAADGILDWIDSDSQSREFGVEADYYSGLTPPYEPRNGPPQTIEELLLVRGVTRAQLLGVDTNRNGLADPKELDTPQIPQGADRSDEAPPHGWSGLLTIDSAESNLNPRGEPRINLNADDLTQLHDQLTRSIDERWATFVVAYRQFGPYPSNAPAATKPRGQLDLKVPSRYRIGSLFDLVDARTSVRWQGDTTSTILVGPLDSRGESFAEQFQKISELVTTVPLRRVPGRINVDVAPREVLMTIPGIEETVVDEILAKRDSSNERKGNDGWRTLAWLAAEQVASLDVLRKIGPYITAGGDMYRAQVVAFSTHRSPTARVEIIVDHTGRTARVVSWKDLSALGRGYSMSILASAGSPGSTSGRSADWQSSPMQNAAPPSGY